MQQPCQQQWSYVKNGKIVTAIFGFSVPYSDCLFQQSDKLEKRPSMQIVIIVYKNKGRIILMHVFTFVFYTK